MSDETMAGSAFALYWPDRNLVTVLGATVFLVPYPAAEAGEDGGVAIEARAASWVATFSADAEGRWCGSWACLGAVVKVDGPSHGLREVIVALEQAVLQTIGMKP